MNRMLSLMLETNTGCNIASVLCATIAAAMFYSLLLVQVTPRNVFLLAITTICAGASIVFAREAARHRRPGKR